MTMSENTPQTAPSGASPWRFLPFLVLIVGLGLFFVMGGTNFLSFEEFSSHRGMLLDLVARNHVLSAGFFILIYGLDVAFSLPGGTILTLAGGFLFGTFAGTAYVVVGATLGASALFFAARTAFGDVLMRRAGPAIVKMEKGFQENAWSYLFFLRLVPLFPFWLVNLVPAFLGVGFGVYVVTTFIGIIPGTLVYASIGSGLGAVFDRGETPDLGLIFDPQILLPLLGLGFLALLPVLYKLRKPAGN